MDISKYFSLILYIVGIAGVCFSILLVGFKIHKKNRLLSIITLLIIFLSLFSVGSGTVFSIINKKDTSANAITVDDKKEPESTKKEENKTETSIIVDSKFVDSQAFITITNTSDSVFNGEVKLKFFDSKNNNVDNKTIPVKNLLPNNTTECTLFVENAIKLTYTFNGKFEDDKNSNIAYSIKSMGIGGNYLRFDVVASKKDKDTINKICEEFKSTYTSKLCSGFLIYFVDDKTDFTNSYAEYYCDYTSKTIKLTVY